MTSNGRASTADVVLISGDARKVPLADESVQCIVTSPPYWGLRKYAGEQELIWNPLPLPPAEQSIVDDLHKLFPPSDTCEHRWQEERRNGISGGQNQNSKAENGDGATYRPLEPSTHGTCARCGAWRGAYGLEPTVEMYVAHSLEILRELRRVLRKDGVLFWNLGDSYAATRGYGGDNKPSDLQSTNRGSLRAKRYFFPNRHPQAGPKHKDLVLMPARIALAAQADGWWVRSVIIWAKPNPMPESVTDRPTDSYEHILMLTKSARYFWDANAVREPSTEPDRVRADQIGGNKGAEVNHSPGSIYRTNGYKPGHDERDGKERFCSGTGGYVPAGGRNMRNLWEFPTQPYAGAHFATFPEELPRRCILAATSARGCCAQCGAPWERITYRQPIDEERVPAGWHQSQSGRWRPEHVERFGEEYEGKNADEDPNASGRRMLLNLRKARENGYTDSFGECRTIGWTPTCQCRGQASTVPCVVLDPFGGSGTTGRVAIELGRRAILLDLAYGTETAEDRAKGRSYLALAKERTSNVQVRLPLL